MKDMKTTPHDIMSKDKYFICEMKYSSDEYEIDKSYDGDLRNKIKRFKEMNNCRKSIQLTMITTYGVKKNKYSNIIGNQVLLDDLFC